MKAETILADSKKIAVAAARGFIRGAVLGGVVAICTATAAIAANAINGK